MEQGAITVLAGVMAAFAAPLFLDLALCVVGNLWPARKLGAIGRAIELAVVVPAHDEEGMIARTVLSLKASDRTAPVFVVAHNCTDGTAEAAAKAGATVLVLDNPRLRGKGAALRHGFQAALKSGANAVLVVDADSVVSANLMTVTRAALAAGAEATQCRYELERPVAGASSPLARLRRLAFRGMNVLRARGRAGWGLSAGIFGNGFALAASVLKQVPFDADSIAEDLEYHTKLVAAGLHVVFVEESWVHAQSPVSGAARASQEARWEGGRFRVASQATRRLVSAAMHGRLGALETLGEVWSLPLSRGVFALLLTLALPVHWLHVFALSCAAVTVLYVMQAAALGEEPWLDLAALAVAPVYLAWKAMITPLVMKQSRSRAEWARTKREAPQP
jgi:cellulose synthase/poly-beta-1,6-N-acetylglucosamine synthase-like glycosyltransferase